MSLDVYLVHPETGDYAELDDSLNITGNLCKLARQLGIVDVIWSPEETIGIFKNPNKVTGLEMLPSLYRAHKLVVDSKISGVHDDLLPSNSWGSHASFIKFLSNYIKACALYPDYIIRTN